MIAYCATPVTFKSKLTRAKQVFHSLFSPRLLVLHSLLTVPISNVKSKCLQSYQSSGMVWLSIAVCTRHAVKTCVRNQRDRHQRPILYVESSSNWKSEWGEIFFFFFVMLMWVLLCWGCVRLAHSLCVYLDLLRCPLVQVDRFDPGDVHSQVAVDASATDTHEHPQVPRSPSRTWKGKRGDIFTLTSS